MDLNEFVERKSKKNMLPEKQPETVWMAATPTATPVPQPNQSVREPLAGATVSQPVQVVQRSRYKPEAADKETEPRAAKAPMAPATRRVTKDKAYYDAHPGEMPPVTSTPTGMVVIIENPAAETDSEGK